MRPQRPRVPRELLRAPRSPPQLRRNCVAAPQLRAPWQRQSQGMRPRAPTQAQTQVTQPMRPQLRERGPRSPRVPRQPGLATRPRWKGAALLCPLGAQRPKGCFEEAGEGEGRCTGSAAAVAALGHASCTQLRRLDGCPNSCMVAARADLPLCPQSCGQGNSVCSSLCSRHLPPLLPLLPHPPAVAPASAPAASPRGGGGREYLHFSHQSVEH